MAGTVTRTGFLVATWLAVASGASAAPVAPTTPAAPITQATDSPPLRYDISFQLHDDRLDRVEVRATATTGADGRVDFLMPWQGAADVHAEKGTLDTSSAGHWIVQTKPGDEVVLVWHSSPAAAWRSLDSPLWRAVIVRPDAVATVGGALLALPDGAKDRLAGLHWSMPPGWTVSTTLKEGTQTIEQLDEGSFMMARYGASATRKSGDATIQVMTLDAKRVDVERVANDMVAVMDKVIGSGLRHDFTFNIVDLDGEGQAVAVTARPSGGIAHLLPSVSYDNWLPFVVGALVMPTDESIEPSTAWYTQGFTTFRTIGVLRNAGLVSTSTLAYLLNQATTRYGDSPVRRASNQRVVEEYTTIRELRELPLSRGALFAMLLDAHIREATGGTQSLEDALARMPGRTDDPGPALIDAVAAIGGGDIAPLYQRYIIDGDLLQLPRDALGPCFTIGTVADWSGWQTQHVFAKPSCPTKIARAP